MKAIVVDDERLARVELRRLLRAHPEVEIVGEARAGPEAVGLVAAVNPDLMFLDIQMPGMTGFDVLEQLPQVPQVIFTTAFDQYAIRAFEVNALDYLTKPVSPARLAIALSRVRSPASAPLDQVFIRDGERCWIVRLADVFLFESEGNYTRVRFAAERPLIRRSLNDLEARLDPARFFRANRRQIVNLTAIRRTSPGSDGGMVVTLEEGVVAALSRRRAARLRAILRL